jgi:hypothetical protein
MFVLRKTQSNQAISQYFLKQFIDTFQSFNTMEKNKFIKYIPLFFKIYLCFSENQMKTIVNDNEVNIITQCTKILKSALRSEIMNFTKYIPKDSDIFNGYSQFVVLENLEKITIMKHIRELHLQKPFLNRFDELQQDVTDNIFSIYQQLQLDELANNQ